MTRPAAVSRRAAIAALAALAVCAASARLAFADAAAADPAAEAAALGWTVLPAAAPACALSQPDLEATMAVWLSVNRPQDLPRPLYSCDGVSAFVPLARDPALLQRIEGTPPRVRWNVQVAGRTRATAAALAVDFPPFQPEDRKPAAPHAGSGTPAVVDGRPLAVIPRPVIDPATRGRGSKFNRVPEPIPAPHVPQLAVAAVGDGISSDALVATADSATWLAVEVTGEQARLRFSLGPERVFGGDGRLLVAPRALQPDCETVVLAVDPSSLAVTSLGRPAPPEAGRFLRVTDARDRAGAVEVLVVVDQLSSFGGIASPWGLLARREGGKWSFPERYFTPAAPGVLPELRFHASDDSLLLLEAGATRASRPLRAAPPAAVP